MLKIRNLIRLTAKRELFGRGKVSLHELRLIQCVWQGTKLIIYCLFWVFVKKYVIGFPNGKFTLHSLINYTKEWVVGGLRKRGSSATTYYTILQGFWHSRYLFIPGCKMKNRIFIENIYICYKQYVNNSQLCLEGFQIHLL